MWTTLAMTAALALGQTGELTLTNARPTYGVLGATRKDADNLRLLAGDVIFISFDIENLREAADGQVKYSMGMELTNKEGKILFRQEAQDLDAYNSLGGRRVPAFVASDIGTDTPPGEYTITAIVRDRNAQATKKLSRKFEVLPKGFGLVRLALAYDERGLPAPPMGVAGQRLLVNFAVAGFERDKTSKMPHLTTTMRVLENGRPTLEKHSQAAVKDVPEGQSLVPLTFALNLNRPGKFTVELKVTDDISTKSATQTFDLSVVEPK